MVSCRISSGRDEDNVNRVSEISGGSERRVLTRVGAKGGREERGRGRGGGETRKRREKVMRIK